MPASSCMAPVCAPGFSFLFVLLSVAPPDDGGSPHPFIAPELKHPFNASGKWKQMLPAHHRRRHCFCNLNRKGAGLISTPAARLQGANEVFFFFPFLCGVVSDVLLAWTSFCGAA